MSVSPGYDDCPHEVYDPSWEPLAPACPCCLPSYFSPPFVYSDAPQYTLPYAYSPVIEVPDFSLCTSFYLPSSTNEFPFGSSIHYPYSSSGPNDPTTLDNYDLDVFYHQDYCSPYIPKPSPYLNPSVLVTEPSGTLSWQPETTNLFAFFSSTIVRSGGPLANGGGKGTQRQKELLNSFKGIFQDKPQPAKLPACPSTEEKNSTFISTVKLNSNSAALAIDSMYSYLLGMMVPNGRPILLTPQSSPRSP